MYIEYRYLFSINKNFKIWLFQHVKRSLKPTDRYYRNEHLEIQAEATNKYATATNRDVSVV